MSSHPPSRLPQPIPPLPLPLWRRLGRAFAARGRAVGAALLRPPQRRLDEGDYAVWDRMTLRDWLDRHQREIVFDRCRWMGIPMLKSPLDSWIYQEIIAETRPQVLVELGSHSGGSTLYFAQLFQLLGEGEVLSLDIDRSRYQARHERIVEITGDCSDPAILAQVQARCAGKRCMVIHDADHRREAVLRDLELYGPLVSPGCYLIVEDGILDLFPASDHFGHLSEGPLPAIEDFLAGHPEFEVDQGRERYLMTYSPRGFLRRRA